MQRVVLTSLSSQVIVKVLKSIPDKNKIVANETLTLGKLPEHKALGVKWNISKDTLGFQTKMA